MQTAIAPKPSPAGSRGNWDRVLLLICVLVIIWLGGLAGLVGLAVYCGGYFFWPVALWRWRNGQRGSLKRKLRVSFILQAIVQLLSLIPFILASRARDYTAIDLLALPCLVGLGFFVGDSVVLVVGLRKGEGEPNQSSQSTTRAVTPPAGQETRQP